MNTQESVADAERLYEAAIIEFKLHNLILEKRSGLTILCNKIVLEHINETIEEQSTALKAELPSIGIYL